MFPITFFIFYTSKLLLVLKELRFFGTNKSKPYLKRDWKIFFLFLQVFLTFSAAVEFSSQRNVALPRDWIYSDKFCNNWVLQIMANNGVTVSVTIKNLQMENKAVNISCPASAN